MTCYDSAAHVQPFITFIWYHSTSFRKHMQLNKYRNIHVCISLCSVAIDDATWTCDVWSQIGHVYELKRDVPAAKSSYLKALEYNQVGL